MATTDGGIQFTIRLNGLSFNRSYYKSDAINNVIVLGRLSSTTSDARNEVGGYIVSPGRAAFVSPVMSRQHARLVFSGDNEIYISDPQNHSHHGTYVSRHGRIFRVDHPHPLQTGDVVTFGKTVHRGGEVYEPLSARVRILAEPTHHSFASYTGHGYSLPPNIDIEVEPEEDNEVYKDDNAEEHPSTYKFYSIQEIQDDTDDIVSLPSPIFPRGLDARQEPPPMMPGGFNGIPEASPFAFNVHPQPTLFDPPVPVVSYLQNSLPDHPHEAPFLGAHDPNPLAILAPIFRVPPPSVPPLLPPIIPSRPRPAMSIPSHVEIIDVDDNEDEREIIDVDAAGSPDSSVRETSPFGNTSRSSEDESDQEYPGGSRFASPASSAGTSESFSEPNALSEESEDIKGVLRILQDLTDKCNTLLAYRSRSRRRIVENKIQLDTKIASLQQNLALLKSEIEAEQQGVATNLEKRAKEAMEDIDTRKRGFMEDLGVYEDDVTYEVDRVMDRVEELGAKTSEFKSKVDGYGESLKKLKDELEAALRAQLDQVKAMGAEAAEKIDEVVVGVKRRHEEIDETPHRARSPSVAMSVSPEPEPQVNAIDVATETRHVETHQERPTVPAANIEDDSATSILEPPHKRQRLDTKDVEGPRASRIIGALAATTFAVCWALGKVGEMSTLGDV